MEALGQSFRTEKLIINKLSMEVFESDGSVKVVKARDRAKACIDFAVVLMYLKINYL
jgi:hypothetical protein